MPNWKTYKDQGPAPWNFTKSQAEAKYNQGDAIRNAGQPVWDINATMVGVGGTPITSTHHPNCGMWNGIENPGYPPPPPFTPVVGVAYPYIQFVAWTPNAGGSTFGRFIGAAVPGYGVPDIKIYYSDDGGYTWPITPPTPFTGFNKSFINLIHIKEKDLFVATGYDGYAPFFSWTATSQDGITWTAGTPYASGRSMDFVEWFPAAGKYFGTTSTGGGISYLYSSPDALNWTEEIAIGPSNVFRGLCYLDSTLYLYAYNYNVFLKTTGLAPVTTVSLVGAEIPFLPTPMDAYRGEALHNDSRIIYNLGYFDGSSWTLTNHRFTRADYNPISDDPSKAGLFATIYPPDTYGLYVSRDGISWTFISSGAKVTTLDVAVGYERVIATSGTNYLTVITVS